MPGVGMSLGYEGCLNCCMVIGPLRVHIERIKL